MDLRVNLKLDGSGFTQGLTSLRQGLNTSFSGMQSQLAAAFSVGAIVALSKKTIDYASHMRDLSDRLGVNVEWLQKMGNAAALTGAKADDLANVLNAVAQSREEALRDPKSRAAAAFGRMGFSQDEIQNMPQQQFIEKLAQAFSTGASAQMSNDVIEVGGRAAKNLLAAFAGGLEDAGSIIPEWVIDELDRVGDEFTILGKTLMAEVGPPIVFVIDLLRKFAGNLKIAFAGIGGFITGGSKGFYEAATSEDHRQAELQEKIEIALSKARKARRDRENSGPGFAPHPPKAETERAIRPALRQAYSDSMIAVGNFLGTTNRSNIESIQMETNRILRDHTRLLTKISEGRVATSSWDDLGLPDSGTATSSF